MVPDGLKEVVRSVHVSYPVPFLAALFGLIGLALADLARYYEGGKAWLLLGAACLMFLVAVAIVIKAVFASPGLLRSERHEFFERMLNVTGDDKTDPATRAMLHAKLIESWDDQYERRPSGRSRSLKRDIKEGDIE